MRWSTPHSRPFVLSKVEGRASQRPSTTAFFLRSGRTVLGLALMLFSATPAAAQTFAITNGTVALGDGSEPIPGGTVLIRDGRVVAAGGMRFKLPADTIVIDATGKWVTPGIVAGFSRLGLSEVDLGAEASDDTAANGP
ncbi:MAG: hypothetical protein ABIO68_04675, partial [Sphingomicrobium sp.]